MGQTVIIIGSGFSSLSAACYLAKAGFSVKVLEKNEQLGGRASVLKKNAFTFDMGPSWYWMPDVFEKFFGDFGKKTSDYYQLEKLSPAYRVFFEDSHIDIADDLEKIIKTFEELDPGSGDRLRKFIEQSKKNYQIAVEDLVYRPGISILELVTPETATRLNLFFTNISAQVKKITQHPYLQSILEFPVLFLGAKPENTPAFYNFMNYADFGLGTWYPKGGMGKVVEGMVSLAEELGVRFYLNTEVKKVLTEKEMALGVETDKGIFRGDIIISGADYAHTDTLLGEDKNYASYWDKKTFAPSSILYYIGFEGACEEVLHHNLFFDTDFKKHAEQIYDRPEFPEAPLFYANFPSQTDASLAPEGMSTAFFLIPVAPGLKDSLEVHEKYLDLIADRLRSRTGFDLKPKIRMMESFGIQDFKDRYHSCKGNAYGLANTLMQTSVLRPGIRNRHLYNFYYTGQLTVPGPGVPPALISGKVVSNFIIKKHV